MGILGMYRGKGIYLLPNKNGVALSPFVKPSLVFHARARVRATGFRGLGFRV